MRNSIIITHTDGPNQIVDLADLCTECLRDTSIGSGTFVNRVPSTRQDGVGSPIFDGWLCVDCQMVECDDCGRMKLDYVMKPEGGAICNECVELAPWLDHLWVVMTHPLMQLIIGVVLGFIVGAYAG